MRHALPLALTMGEPAGIGGEISLKAWAELQSSGPAFVVYDDAERLRTLAQLLKLPVPVECVATAADAANVFSRALPVIHTPLPHRVIAGKPDPANGHAVIAAIEHAVKAVQRGECSAVVTNPIQKSALYAAGFRHPGHTEFVAELLSGGQTPVMMLLNHALRVVPVTIHVALKEAIASLTTGRIIETATITAQALRSDFAIEAPRLAIAGLNPHAGEGGSMGVEDIEIVAPAIASLQAMGIQAFGPLPPDTMFTPQARKSYDCAIGMYHDQVLIPLKTLDMEHGINATLGLAIVRTSPDHGTALDIAGKGIASPASLIAAMRLAAQLADGRRKGR